MFVTCYVEPDNPGAFEELLLPSVNAKLKKGEMLPIIGLLSQNVAVGAIALNAKEGRIEILSLYVAPDYRKKGGGRLLLETAELLASRLESKLYARFTVVDEETELLEKALSACGLNLRNDKEARTYMVVLADCEEEENIRNEEHDKNLKFLEGLSPAKLKSLTKLCESKEVYVPKGGFLAEKLDKGLSAVYEEKSGLKGFITVEHISYKDGIRITAAYNDDSNPMIMMWLLKAVLSKALEKYDDKTPLLIDVTGETADKYVRYLLPEAEVISRTYYKTA